MWQYMLTCGVGAKSVTHLMQYHQLQWEVAKVKPLMNSNMTLTVLNLFIWGFTSLSTLYRSYHDGLLEGQRKPVHRVR